MTHLMYQSEMDEHKFNNRPNNRLSKDSQAVVKLYDLFAKGIINGSEEPKSVWQSDPIFQVHKLNNFRTCYNNIRREVMGNKREEGN